MRETKPNVFTFIFFTECNAASCKAIFGNFLSFVYVLK